MKNIKKRADISAARKNAADARWKNEEQGEEPVKPTVLPQIPAEEQFESKEQWESFEAAIKWYRDIIDERFQEWADTSKPFSPDFESSFTARELVNNILDEISEKKTLKINNRNIDTIKFLESLLKFFGNEQRKDELVQSIYEVEDKCAKGEVKNKQNYLISTLWNKAQMQVN